LHILWFNWRDIEHPDAGGAEVLTHQIARRLANRGYQITVFSSEFAGCQPKEMIDDVEYVRSGGRYLVYKNAREFYKNNCTSFDLVIDEINMIPFFTPRYVKDKPVVALIHQLAREQWFYETPFPLAYIGRHVLEDWWLSLYRNIPTITVSDSTRKDLDALGFGMIRTIPEGLDFEPLPELAQKESVPTIIFTGRLKKAKLPHHAVKAFALIKKEVPDAKMWVVGEGYMMKKLKEMNVQDVTFCGKVSNQFKLKLMRSAHIALVPGLREGWGLVVTECNAMGTPVVAYNVHGLRDAVVDGKTGVLTSSNTPEAMAEEAIRLLNDRTMLERLSRDALKDSRRFSWDKTADKFERILKSEIRYPREMFPDGADAAR
jgi:glycosyltransferase involved in cell wall biosynthesis